MSRPAAGQIVLVDWRSSHFPGEPGGVRPGVVVEGEGLFPEDYVNLLIVPLTRDEGLAYPSFAERIEPTEENGAPSVCWALAHHVCSESLQRVRASRSRITDEQLRGIRARIALALALAGR